jgi:hypothetical protein
MRRLRDLLRRPGAGLVLVAVAVALLSALSLAWVVPSPEGSVASPSYRVGYNNAVAVVGVLAAVLLALLGGMRSSRALSVEGGRGEADAVVDEVPVGPAPGSRGPGLTVDSVALAVSLVAATAVTSWLTWGVPFADHPYFFTRYAYALQGAMPYSAFDFPYGPVILYAPVIVFRILGSGGIEAATGAYYASVALQHAVGALLLGWAMQRLPLARRQLRALFWVVGGFTLLNFWNGPNYTLLRFAVPLAAVALFARTRARAAGTPLGAVRTGLVALGLVVASAAVSPEMGAAVFAAVLAMTGASLWRRERSACWTLLPLVLVPLGALLAIPGAGAWLADLAGGAYNLPVLPSPFVLIYLASAIIAGFGAGRRLFAADESSAAIVGFAAAGALLVAPALGRADIAHVFWNGIPLFVAAAVVLAAFPGRRYAVYLAGLAIVFLIGAIPMVVLRGWSMTSKAATVASDGSHRTESAAWKRLLGADMVAMPMGADDDLVIAYALRGALVPVHGDFMQGPVSERQLATIERDLSNARWAVLPTASAAYLEREIGTDLAAREPWILGGPAWDSILQFPAHLHQRRADYPGARRLAEVLARDFSPVEVVGPYVMLKRKSVGAAP